MEMKTIEIITLPVADQQKAKEFYLKMGLRLIAEAPMGNGQNWVQLGLPNQPTSLALLNFHGIMFETDDVEREVRDLKAKGILTGKIDNTPWGKFVQLKDLDGNGLSFHQQ
jgi:catechol 2,3-dioxygenase-like lactoylglutathione lyase family enzyme